LTRAVCGQPLTNDYACFSGSRLVMQATIISFSAKMLSRYASYIGQAMWIFIGFFVLTAFPLLFGISAYGKFAATTALTFIAQKIIDLAVESNIADVNYRNTIRSAAYAAVIVLVPLAIIDASSTSEVYQVEYLLLLSLIASNIVLNISFQVLTAITRALYLTVFALLAVFISITFWLSGSTEISTVLIAINFSGSAIGALFLIRSVRGVSSSTLALTREPMPGFVAQILDVTYRFLFSSFSLFITFGSVLIASTKFNYEEIGIFRISLTIIAAGVFISPINPKEMYGIARNIKNNFELYAFFQKNKLAYIFLISVWILATLYSIFELKDVVGILIYSICLYEAILYSTVIEKVFLAHFEIRKSSFFVAAYAGISIALLFLQDNVEFFVLTIASCIILYPVYLSIILGARFYRSAIVPIVISAALLFVAAASRGLVPT
jgi:hypothetical protein